MTTTYSMMKVGALLALMILFGGELKGQTSVTLENILDQVIENSFAVNSARNSRKIAQLDYDFYRAQIKPQFAISASLPNFINTSTAVTQPDGTIAFQSVKQTTSSLALDMNQAITATGGNLFLRSDLTRFEDLNTDLIQYNGIPVRVGISQPIFGYNPWKYQQKIQPLLLEENRRNYTVQVEQALQDATAFYFDILIAKQNRDIALTNEKVNEKLLQITEERFTLGKVSKDEKLQLEIELNNAKLSVVQANYAFQNAIAALRTFLGGGLEGDTLIFELPTQLDLSTIDIPALLQAAKRNRPELIAAQRNKLEQDDALADAKQRFGFNANVTMSYGFARGSKVVGDIYSDPFEEQQINLSVSMPIVDWGRRRALLESIKTEQKNIALDFQQQLLNIDNDIQQQAYLCARLQRELLLLQSIVGKAEQRFEISNERYILGDIDITNLTIAQREKDQAKRNYINALQTYWVTYYNLRRLSGFDIVENKEILY